MNAAVKKLPLAEADTTQAAEWFDDQRPGLGADFVREMAAVIASLATASLLHAIRFADVRRAPSNGSAHTECFTFWMATR